MRIGFLGIQADNANLGLSALAYSGVNLACKVAPADTEVILFSANSSAELERMRTTLGLGDHRPISAVALRLSDPRGMARAVRLMTTCDVIIDFTGGDSFSDIYGVRRLAKKLFHKQLVLLSRTPLLLAPQTYGPLKRRASVPWFRHVVRRAVQVYARDELSAEFLRGLVRRQIQVATDVAVTLPWDPTMFDLGAGARELRVGFNVSGLLWDGGYTGDNQFQLRTDYRRYCDAVLDGLSERGCEVHLVPHVLARPWEHGQEDDATACAELATRHPGVILAPSFASPVEAKSYISQLGAFVGSRMHATIGSFTAGVATVPVAYSRKFAGFFGNLDYAPVVDLAALDTEDAVSATLALVDDRERLREAAVASRAKAEAQIKVFIDGLAELLRPGAGTGSKPG